MMTLPEIMLKVERAWLQILADGRERLVRLCIQKGATDDEIDSVLEAHDEMQRQWFEEAQERLRDELVSFTRHTVH
jgi:hypothetical protein